MIQIRLAIHGAGGRMGQRLVALGHADPQLRIAAALESAANPNLGRDAGRIAGIETIGVPLSTTLDVDADCVIDFSVPDAVARVADLCAERKLPLVLATTGLTDVQRDRIAELAQDVPVVSAPNMSLAVNLTMKLATLTAEALKDLPGRADVEIVERHHRFKEDAPSGTALHFGELISQVMGQLQHVHGRSGRPGQRPRDEIGYHALRVGDNPGEHTVVFGMMGETIELTVRATSRDCYALGALEAAKFVVTQKPGSYTMADVLGLGGPSRRV